MLIGGNKVLISHRRLFPEDQSRYFLGEVDEYENGMVKLTGYTWIKDQLNEKFHKRPSKRTKIMALASGTLICYLLPSDLNPDVAIFTMSDHQVWLKDGSTGFTMELTEGIFPKSKI